MKKQLFQQKRQSLPYAGFVLRVNQYSWAHLNAQALAKEVRDCDKFDYPLVYSLIKEVVFRCTGFLLFDTQICAAYTMQLENIAELPTGEGKTLTAAVTAACFALQGRLVRRVQEREEGKAAEAIGVALYLRALGGLSLHYGECQKRNPSNGHGRLKSHR